MPGNYEITTQGPIAILSIDHDSTLKKAGKTNENIFKYLASFIAVHPEIKIIIISSGSNRQSYYINYNNIKLNPANGSHFTALIQTHAYCQKKWPDIEWQLDPELLSDIFSKKEAGENFYLALNADQSEQILALFTIVPNLSDCFKEFSNNPKAFKDYSNSLNAPDPKTWPIFLNTFSKEFNGASLEFLYEAHNYLEDKEPAFIQLYTVLKKLHTAQEFDSFSSFASAWSKHSINLDAWEVFLNELLTLTLKSDTTHEWSILLKALDTLSTKNFFKKLSQLIDTGLSNKHWPAFNEELDRLKNHSDVFLTIPKQLAHLELLNLLKTLIASAQSTLIEKKNSYVDLSIALENFTEFSSKTWNINAYSKFFEALQRLSKNRDPDSWAYFSDAGKYGVFLNYSQFNNLFIQLATAVQKLDNALFDKLVESVKTQDSNASNEASLKQMQDLLNKLKGFSPEVLKKHESSVTDRLSQQGSWVDNFKCIARAKIIWKMLEDPTPWNYFYEMRRIPFDPKFETILEAIIKSLNSFSADKFKRCADEFESVKHALNNLDSKEILSKAQNKLTMLKNQEDSAFFVNAAKILSDPKLFEDYYKVRKGFYLETPDSSSYLEVCEALSTYFYKAINAFNTLNTSFCERFHSIREASNNFADNMKKTNQLGDNKPFSELIKIIENNLLNTFSLKSFLAIDAAIEKRRNVFDALAQVIPIKIYSDEREAIPQFYKLQTLAEQLSVYNQDDFRKLAIIKKTQNILEKWLSDLKLRNNFNRIVKTLHLVKQLVLYKPFYTQFLTKINEFSTRGTLDLSNQNILTALCSEMLEKLKEFTDNFHPDETIDTLLKKFENTNFKVSFHRTLNNLLNAISNDKNRTFEKALRGLSGSEIEEKCTRSLNHPNKWTIYAAQIHKYVLKYPGRTILYMPFDDLFREVISRLPELASIIPENVTILPCYCRTDGQIQQQESIHGQGKFLCDYRKIAKDLANYSGFKIDKDNEINGKRNVISTMFNIEAFALKQTYVKNFISKELILKNKLYELNANDPKRNEDEIAVIEGEIQSIKYILKACLSFLEEPIRLWILENKDCNVNQFKAEIIERENFKHAIHQIALFEQILNITPMQKKETKVTDFFTVPTHKIDTENNTSICVEKNSL